MYSLRKWMFKPKRTDTSLLAQFFYSDEELNMVATELDSFDGRKDPERCSTLVNQLRMCQDKVLTIVEKIMDQALPGNRANRDFRVKFPDDVLQESLAGQLWFGAECLAAGSSIMNREVESTSMRPLAKALTRHLDYLRSILRDQCLRNSTAYTDKILEALRVFDRLFAEFELSYVSAMVPVKTMKEYDTLQDVIVLFSETTQRALRLNLLTQDMIDDYDPALMFTIPRLAIVCGLLIFPEGPVNPDMDPMAMSDMFRPFQTLLYKIRELLWTLSRDELWLLEKALCSAEEPGQYRNIEHITFEDDHITQNQDTQTPFPLYDANGNQAPNQSHLLEPEYNFCMTQSPSTVTIVANPNYKSKEGEPGGEREGAGPTLLEMAAGGEGVSDNPEEIDPSQVPHHRRFFSDLGQETRTLRHSLSWPESTRRPRLSTSFSDCEGAAADCSILDEDGVRRAMVTHRSHTHEFSFHLPRNTEHGSIFSAEGRDIPDIAVENADSGSESRLSALQRIFITSDSHEGNNCDDNQQISFVTETLNEVFVTDTTFRGMADSLKSSSKLCSKCKDCSCHIEADSARKASSELESSIEGSSARAVSELENVVDGEPVAIPPPPSDLNISGEPICDLCQHCRKCPSCRLPAGPESNSQMDDKSVASPGCSEGLPVESSSQRQCSCGPGDGSTADSPPEESHNCVCSHGEGHQECNTNDDERAQQQKEHLEVPVLRRVKYESGSSTCSSRSPSVHSIEYDWDRESYASTDTSSYDSECHDDEEIALAIHAAEMAARQEARAKFKSSSDLIHRLFVCISGVADQLQTNYAADLRHILKCVFECNASEPYMVVEPAPVEQADPAETIDDEGGVEDENTDNTSPGSTGHPAPASPARSNSSPTRTSRYSEGEDTGNGQGPAWIPDSQTTICTSCKVAFTFVRRRHHCRNCGKIFCGRCSSNFVPLPHYGHTKPVRVCSHCFMFQVTPFTMTE